MNEFNIKNGFISNGDSIVNGTLNVATLSATTYYNLPSTGISGSGTTSYIPVWTSGSSLNNSSVYLNSIDQVPPTVYSAMTLSGVQPIGMAVDTLNNRLYVSEANNNKVRVINLIDYTTITVINVGLSPQGIAFDSLNNRMYVVNYNSGNVSVISTASNTVISTISVGGNPQYIAFDSTNNRMYVTKISNEIKVISTSSNTVISTITNGGTNGVIFVNNKIYSSSLSTNLINVIDTTTNTITSTISVTRPVELTYDSFNNLIWVSNDNLNKIYKINPTTNTLTNTISIPCTGSLQSICFDSVNNYVYITSLFDTGKSVFVLDTVTESIVYTLTVGDYLISVIFDNINNKVYVSEVTTNKIFIINIGNLKYDYIGVNTTTPSEVLEVNGKTKTTSLLVTESANISGSTTSSGNIVALTDLQSMYSVGDEGGQIFLNKPETNTSLNSGVNIDIFRDKLRIFEQGGTNRGVYIDLTTALTNVGSDLLGGINTVSANTSTIHFTGNTVFGTFSSPLSTNITDNLTGAKLGVTQKIYHNSGSAPTVPAGWVLLGSTTYQISTTNIIYAEWSEGSRVEYWIVR